MAENPQTGTSKQAASSGASPTRANLSSRSEYFEKRKAEILRIIYVLLLVLAGAFVWTNWDTIRAFSFRLEGAAIGLIPMVLLIGWYALRRNREISELRGLVRGIELRDKNPESDRQLEQ